MNFYSLKLRANNHFDLSFSKFDKKKSAEFLQKDIDHITLLNNILESPDLLLLLKPNSKVSQSEKNKLIKDLKSLNHDYLEYFKSERKEKNLIELNCKIENKVDDINQLIKSIGLHKVGDYKLEQSISQEKIRYQLNNKVAVSLFSIGSFSFTTGFIICFVLLLSPIIFAPIIALSVMLLGIAYKAVEYSNVNQENLKLWGEVREILNNDFKGLNQVKQEMQKQ